MLMVIPDMQSRSPILDGCVFRRWLHCSQHLTQEAVSQGESESGKEEDTLLKEGLGQPQARRSSLTVISVH